MLVVSLATAGIAFADRRTSLSRAAAVLNPVEVARD